MRCRTSLDKKTLVGGTSGRILNDGLPVLRRHCRRIAAVAAAADVVVALVGCCCCGRQIVTRWRVLTLRRLVCLSPFLISHLSPSASPAGSGSCAVRRCGPLSTRIHQAFLHHVCLFDTSFSSCVEFAYFFASTHSSFVVISSSPSCLSRASTSLPSSLSLLPSLSLSRLSFSLLLNFHFFLSLLLSPHFSLLLLLSLYFFFLSLSRSS